MAHRLSGLDAAFLYFETPTMHMHVGGVVVLDPSTAPDGALDHHRFLDVIAARLHLAPPLRWRLVPVPLGVDHPMWIEDPDFDLAYHVRRAALPSPGGAAELAEYAAEVMSRPLDRRKPLWELHVVEDVDWHGTGERGHVALVTKIHHAAVDGVTGAELTAAILDRTPEPEPAEAEPGAAARTPDREPGELELLARAGLRLATRPAVAARTGLRVLRAARSALPLPGGDAAPERAEPPPAPFDAPIAPWNGAIGPRRRVAFATLPFPVVRAVKDATAAKVNDVLLTVAAGALRSYLADVGWDPDRPLVAMCPISVRAGSGGPGNQLSAMLAALHVDEPDPAERLRRTRTATTTAKQQHGAMGATTIQQLAELAPAGVATMAARLYSRTRAADRHRPVWNTIVSNVPGPAHRLYCAGAAVEALHPLGPIHEMNGLNITLFSYAGDVAVGLLGDWELAVDLDRLAKAMPTALDELAAAVGA